MRLIGFVAILEAERDNIKIKKIVCLVTSHTTYNVMEFSVRSREENPFVQLLCDFVISHPL